jgi:regulatory protein
MLKKRVYDIKIAVERLRNYCALQDKCQWDVIKKMQEWGLLKISQNHILEMLIQEQYVDEERYSRSFCRGKFNIKKWGKIKITNELKKKKISAVCISKGLEEINDLEYQNELDNQFHKKKCSINEKNYFIKKKKLATYLINKGYESDLVWNKISELKE